MIYSKLDYHYQMSLMLDQMLALGSNRNYSLFVAVLYYFQNHPNYQTERLQAKHWAIFAMYSPADPCTWQKLIEPL